MKITCPECGKIYEKVPFDRLIKYKRVKCSACKHKFVVPHVAIYYEVDDDNKWKKIEAWFVEQSITEWVYAHNWGGGEPTNKHEPTMEDILVSIRRILSEDSRREIVFFNKEEAMYFKMVWC